MKRAGDDDVPNFFNEPADPAVIHHLSNSVDLPPEYFSFLLQHNGGEIQFDGLSVILWNAEDLEGYNRAYHVDEFAPGMFLVGTSGGGEAYGFDLSDPTRPFVRIPFI